jgi:Tfp pilus assembly protein PilX
MGACIMNVPASNLKNNNGAIMILFSMMLLMLLTIISFAASRTANTEVKIAGNEYLYHNNFYCAEGAVVESLDKMQALAAIDVDSLDWMMNESPKVDRDADLFEYWTDDSKTADDAVPEAATVCSDHTEFVTIYRGVLAGSSLDMSKPTKHAFAVYGRSNNRGLVMIKVGYRKEY